MEAQAVTPSGSMAGAALRAGGQQCRASRLSSRDRGHLRRAGGSCAAGPGDGGGGQEGVKVKEEASSRGSSVSGPSGRMQRRKPLTEEERARRTRMEDELKDTGSFIDYLAPRPLRRIFFAFSAISCTVAFVIALTKVISSPSLELVEGGFTNLGINLAGLTVFAGLYIFEGQQAEQRVIRRKEVRQAQIKIGDREILVDESGQKISVLKPVDDDWIIRRLDRWGQKDLLPQIGPKKGAILQDLVRQHRPGLIVEVGSFTGYSAIKMAQAMPRECHIISYENDWKWCLVAKRFVWQSKMSNVIDIRWGDALKALPKLERSVDFLFLDGKPWEYLDYLKAAEPWLSPGAIIVADNAGIFKKSLKPYLAYVRTSGLYQSKVIECKLEYQDNIPDAIEVSALTSK